MKSILNSNLKDKLKNIAKEYDLDLFILFGSRANNTHKKTSDYDLAFLKSNIELEDEMNLFDDIIHLLKFEKVDLINISKNHDVKVRYEIFQKGIVIYEKKKGLFSILKGKAYIDYHDFQKFTKNRLKILKKSILELKT